MEIGIYVHENNCVGKQLPKLHEMVKITLTVIEISVDIQLRQPSKQKPEFWRD